MAITQTFPSLRSPARAFVDFLIKEGVLKEQFKSVIGSRDFLEIDQYLLSHKLVGRDQLSEIYAKFYKLPYIRLVNRPIKPSVMALLPELVAKKYSVLPYDLEGPKLSLAVGDPARLHYNAPSILANLRHERGLVIDLAIVPQGEIEAVFNQLNRPRNDLAAAAAKGMEPATPTIPIKPIHVDVPKNVHEPAADATPASVATSAPHKILSLNKKDLIKEVEPRAKNIDLTNTTIKPETLNKIPKSVAERYQIIVFDQQESKSKFEPAMIKIAAVNPDEPKTREIINYIESKNKVLVDRYSTSPDSFKHALGFYKDLPKAEPEVKIEEEVTEKARATDEKVELPPPAVKPITPETKSVSSGQITIPKATVDEVNPDTQSDDQSRSKPTTKVAGVEEGIVLSSDDIVNRPTVGESTEELQRLAREQENSLESQDLDRLLKGPVLSVEDLGKVFKGGVIPEIVAATLFLAIRMKASDVHVEALANAVRMRFRIDGILHDVLSVPHFLHAPLISRIKILSKMKIDEQRVPQDGRFDVIIDKRQVDLRVSTLPTVHGEKIVMRLLDKSEGVLTLEQLGVTGTNFDTLISNVNKPYGIILATGPTGSGKSTTLYAVLSRLSKPGVNIITLEDPVEYELAGVNQAQVKPQIGFTFAEGLRSVLRQDPNIIMVGEVRDLETAAMSTHAALTGHLVLTTLHTNDAAGALPRLINMGVEPFLITSSLNAVVGQRLVRKVCDKCREKVVIPHALLETIKAELAAMPSGQMKNIDPNQLVFYHGRGCSECNNGYSGRIGIYEVLAMTAEVEDLAVRKAPASEIKKAAIANGMITMTQDGLLKALKGITTVDEIMRVTTTHTKEVPGLE